MLLDPAVNLLFVQMKREVESSRNQLEQAQNDLAAWKFTPDRLNEYTASFQRVLGCRRAKKISRIYLFIYFFAVVGLLV